MDRLNKPFHLERITEEYELDFFLEFNDRVIPESGTHKSIGTARHQVRSRSILLQVLDNAADSAKSCAFR